MQTHLLLTEAQQGVLERAGLDIDIEPFDELEAALRAAWSPRQPDLLRLPCADSAREVLWSALIDQGNYADEQAEAAWPGAKRPHRDDARSWYALADRVRDAIERQAAQDAHFVGVPGGADR